MSPTSTLATLAEQAQQLGYEAAVAMAEADLQGMSVEQAKNFLFDLAALAKLHDRFADSRQFFRRSAELGDRHNVRMWLEWAKFEEECGELHFCHTVIHQALQYCGPQEALVVKGIKV
jgi:hypothetical protein